MLPAETNPEPVVTPKPVSRSGLMDWARERFVAQGVLRFGEWPKQIDDAMIAAGFDRKKAAAALELTNQELAKRIWQNRELREKYSVPNGVRAVTVESAGPEALMKARLCDFRRSHAIEKGLSHAIEHLHKRLTGDEKIPPKDEAKLWSRYADMIERYQRMMEQAVETYKVVSGYQPPAKIDPRKKVLLPGATNPNLATTSSRLASRPKGDLVNNNGRP